MIELSPKEVASRFGPMFSRGLLTVIDERRMVVEVVEECSARGPVEWDLVNRLRAGGVAYAGWVEGLTLVLRAKIGKSEVKFGAADLERGGQALEAVEVHEDLVYTQWVGVAGAGLGLAACLAQAPGVVKALYPSEDDLTKVGGRYVNRVIVATPKYSKLVLAVDNTDVKEKGATWACTLKAARNVCSSIEGVKLLTHRIFQAYQAVPWKTSNNVSSVVAFAVPSGTPKRKVVEEFAEGLRACCFSKDACLAVYEGIEVPARLKDYASRVKREVVGEEEAARLAEEHGVEVLEVTGRKGLIGALAALAYYDEGVDCAALHADPGLAKVGRRVGA